MSCHADQHAHVSTGDQNLKLQIDVLKEAGCEQIFKIREAVPKQNVRVSFKNIQVQFTILNTTGHVVVVSLEEFEFSSIVLPTLYFDDLDNIQFVSV